MLLTLSTPTSHDPRTLGLFVPVHQQFLLKSVILDEIQPDRRCLAVPLHTTILT